MQDSTAKHYLPLLKQISLNLPSKFYSKPDSESLLSLDLRYMLTKLSEKSTNPTSTHSNDLADTFLD